MEDRLRGNYLDDWENTFLIIEEIQWRESRALIKAVFIGWRRKV